MYCIAQAETGLRHVRNARHYAVRLRFLQELVVNKEVAFKYCPTNYQLADKYFYEIFGQRKIRPISRCNSGTNALIIESLFRSTYDLFIYYHREGVWDPSVSMKILRQLLLCCYRHK